MAILNTLQSDLIITEAHSENTKVFWKGTEIPGVVSVKVNSEKDDRQVRLRVNGTADALYMELVSAGIIVRKGK